MTYRVQRWRGYEPSGVTNPWVYANFRQPQRRRGYVSPLVFQTQMPHVRSVHLGDETAEHTARTARMERYAVIGLALSVLSVSMFAYFAFGRRVKKNARKAHKTVYDARGQLDHCRTYGHEWKDPWARGGQKIYDCAICGERKRVKSRRRAR